MEINLQDKVVVITGSSKGIGREIAYRFAAEGAKVVINYNRSKDEAYNLYNQIILFNPHCLVVQADVTKKEDVAFLCEETIKHFGEIDVLINNAGVCDDNLINFLSEDQWHNVIDTNLNSVFLCCKVFSKEMIRRKQGKIINMASYKGQVGFEGQTNYSASKAGVIGFTKALAKELSHFGILVNAVCPGYIETDLNKQNQSKKKKANELSSLGIENNLQDLISFLILLSSEYLKGVNGQVFNIDSRL